MVVETNLQTSDRELPVITYLGPSRGISYLNYQFNLDEINQDELFELSLFQSLLGMIKTQNFSYGDLTNQVLANTGGISSSLVYQQDKRYLVRLKVLKIAKLVIAGGRNFIRVSFIQERCQCLYDSAFK